MSRSMAVAVLALVAAGTVACEDPNKKPIAQINADTQLVERASAAVNEAVRNSFDCDVAKPAMVEARQRLEEAREKVRLAASLQTLDLLKIELERVGRMCP